MNNRNRHYRGYTIDVLQPFAAWQWQAYAMSFGLRRQHIMDGREYETAKQALTAARVAVDVALDIGKRTPLAS